jgi:hypothetical protein
MFLLKRVHGLFSLFLLALFIVFPIHTTSALEHDPVLSLFSEYAGEAHDMLAKGEISGETATALQAAKRFRPVAINPQAIEPKELVPGDTIYLGMFDDAEFYATVKEISLDANGVYGVTAEIMGSKFGFALLSILDGNVLGTITLPELDQEFQVSFLRDLAAHVVQEVDPRRKDVLLSGPPLLPPASVGQTQIFQQQFGAGLDSNQQTIIDLMYVYTPAAQAWAAANATSITHVINQAMQRGNLVLNNSGVGFNLRLVRSERINYTESGNSGTDLERLTATNDGIMDVVHAWRNQSGADLVHFLSLAYDTGGLGWIMSDRKGMPAFAFALSRVQQAHDTYTVIHEIGHNMGAHHHKAQNFQPGPTRWRNWAANTWSAAWRWTGADNRRYCSVMSYEDGRYFPDGQTHTRTPYFSNPSVSFQARPTGNAVNGDNARTLREVRNVVANYRSSLNQKAVMTSPANGSTLPGPTVTFRWSNVSAAQHALWIGTTLGGHNIAVRSTPGSTSAISVPNLPTNGSMIYVRLFTRHGSTWTNNDYRYRSSSGGGTGFFERFERHPVGWLQDSGTWRNASKHWYSPSGRTKYWNATTYNKNYANVNFSAALARSGSQTAANAIIVRGSGPVLSNGHLANGYFFQYTRSGSFGVWKYVNGKATVLKGWTRSPHIRVGGAWNVLQAVANGNTLSFYINGIRLWRGTDSSLKSGRVGMQFFRNETPTDQCRMDWARLLFPPAGSISSHEVNSNSLNSEYENTTMIFDDAMDVFVE